jgi:hypothetical protein
MSAVAWLAEALKSAESGSVPTCSHFKNTELGTDLQEKSYINTGILGSVPTVPTVPTEKQGSQLFTDNPKRFFSANDLTADLAPRFAWRIHFPDREPVYATYTPESTHAEVLRGYPDAVAAEAGKGGLCLVPAPEFGPPCLADSCDDRVTCRPCQQFNYSGVCTLAQPGGPVSAQKGYRPARPDTLQRCSGFESKPLERNTP